ncbi:repressor of nif and glnA expression [Paenibacillus shirakamiensis]|uniref:Repressor of nif and glnA expression n=1 Tax=Paenibacillus shirakamiensis TaxID=1265935 RepID=A0ABS4JJ02_9BACL|nr:hypothetical protein [Paenibacillus shirakamiensis]MBP2001679.1 repressor of nif and glnA expression [Paenibacillus shirakamiensis]
MRADIQNLFIRIHMLHNASEDDINMGDMLILLENHGYKVAEREIKQELERLTEDNFLTRHEEQYSITGTGIEELKDIKVVLKELCGEVLPSTTHEKKTSAS